MNPETKDHNVAIVVIVSMTIDSQGQYHSISFEKKWQLLCLSFLLWDEASTLRFGPHHPLAQ